MKQFVKLILLLIFAQHTFAQAPGAFSYQAVVRDADGMIISNQEVEIGIEIIQGAADSTAVYKESFSQNTSTTGVISISVGTGNILSGDFHAIDWTTGTYFLKTIFNGTEMGTTQILSVPYALYSSIADSVRAESQVLSLEGNVLSISGGNSIELPIETSKQSILITGTLTNEEVASRLANELGPNTSVIEINSTRGLTSLEISGKSNLYELKILNNKDLESLSIQGLQQAGRIEIDRNTRLNDIRISGLQSCNFFNLTGSAVSSIEIPDLTSVIDFIGFQDNKNAHTLLLPDLESTGILMVMGNDMLDSVNVNSLKLLKHLLVHTCPVLVYVNLDSVLSGFKLDSFQNGFQVDMVDYFLERLVSLPDAEVKEISIRATYPGIPPSPEGLANVTILESRGYTIYVDE